MIPIIIFFWPQMKTSEGDSEYEISATFAENLESMMQGFSTDMPDQTNYLPRSGSSSNIQEEVITILTSREGEGSLRE